MKADYNILVIGMGTIGTFLLPGYRKLLGDKVDTHVFGVRNDPAKVAELQARMPFQISAGNTAELLRERRPDIVIVSTPPHIIPSVIENDLKPYFGLAREKGWGLPDVYTFGPTPSPDLYMEKLGADVNVVKFLPSMAREKKGIPLQKLGAGFLVFGRPFPAEREKRAFEFSDVFSHTFAVSQDQSLTALSSKIVSYMNANISFVIVDALKASGLETDVNAIASVWRSAFRKHVGFEGEGMYPCSENDLPEKIRKFVSRLSVAWYEGILRYICSTGIPREEAIGFHNANFETFALSAQLSDRAELEGELVRRQTGGGVSQKSIRTFEEYFGRPLYQAVQDWLGNSLNESFFDSAEGIAYMIDMTVNRHAYRLADRKP